MAEFREQQNDILVLAGSLAGRMRRGTPSPGFTLCGTRVRLPSMWLAYDMVHAASKISGTERETNWDRTVLPEMFPLDGVHVSDFQDDEIVMDADGFAQFAEAIARGTATVADIWALTELAQLNLDMAAGDERKDPEAVTSAHRRRMALIRGFGAAGVLALNAALKTRLIRCGNETYYGDVVASLFRPWEHYVVGPESIFPADKMFIVESERHGPLEMVLPEWFEEYLETRPVKPLFP
jgi:hypothetical protein